MMNRYLKVSLLCALPLALFLSAVNAGDWLQFRGPHGQASVDEAQLPTEVKDHLAWTADLPGQGVSSPIVVGNRVLITSSGGMEERRLYVSCYDGDSGEQLWKRGFWATGRPNNHPSSANAAPTPCSDGQLVFAFYSSNDLACLDLDGNLKWFRGLAYDFPKAGNDVGMSSSPIVTDKAVVVQIDNQGDSFVAALDKSTGAILWRITRPRSATWSSPLLIPAAGTRPARIILQSEEGVVLVDADTGNEVWAQEDGSNIIPSSVVADDLILVPANGLTAMRLSGDDEVETVWESKKLKPSTASPIVDGDTVYSLHRGGILVAAKLADGEQLWQTRVGGTYWSTPIVAGNYMYLFEQGGVAKVVDLSKEGEVVSEYDFDEAILGSPAVADGAIYIRSDEHLWKIAEKG